MSRYIDADKLWKDTTTYFDYCEEYLELIEKQPTADVVEVVRCKNCKHYTERKYMEKSLFVCNVFEWHGQPNDYCSFGERKILPKD